MPMFYTENALSALRFITKRPAFYFSVCTKCCHSSCGKSFSILNITEFMLTTFQFLTTLSSSKILLEVAFWLAKVPSTYLCMHRIITGNVLGSFTDILHFFGLIMGTVVYSSFSKNQCRSLHCLHIDPDVFICSLSTCLVLFTMSLTIQATLKEGFPVFA